MQRVLEARWLPAAVFGVALLARVAYLVQARDHPLHEFVFALIDSLYYHRHALEVASGDFLHMSAFYLGPLYAYFMAALYALTQPSPEIVRGAQALLGAFSCLLLFWVGERLYDRRVALLSGLLLAFYPLHLYYTGLLLPTILVVFLNLLLLWLLLRQAEAPSLPGAALAGGVLGLAILAKSNALVLLPLFVAVWFWLQRSQALRQRALWCGVFSAVALASVAPATLHNWVVSERFVLITTSGGRNLWKGNGSIANGTHPLGDAERSQGALGRRLAGKVDPVAAAEEASEYVTRTLEHVRLHPGDVARVMLLKFVLFWNAVELGVRDQFYFAQHYASLLRLPLAFGWLAPLGLVGAVWSFRPRSPALFAQAMLAAQVFSFVAIFVLARYRLVAVACLILFASWLLVHWLEAARRADWRMLGLSAAPAAALAIFVNWPLAEFPRERGFALVYAKIGAMRLRAGEPRAAIEAYRQALDLDWQGYDEGEKRGEALFEIARAQLELGEREAAAVTLRRLLGETTPSEYVRERTTQLLDELQAGRGASSGPAP